MSAVKEWYFRDIQKFLDNDPFYQRLLQENDKSWWQAQDRAFSGEPIPNHRVGTENAPQVNPSSQK